MNLVSDLARQPFASRLKPIERWIDWTPLIDIAFLLLIFMLVTTTHVTPQAVRLNPAKAPSTHSAPLTNLSLLIDSDHVIYRGSPLTPIELPSLAAWIEETLQTSKAAPTVTLTIDESVPASTLIPLLRVLHSYQLPVEILYATPDLLVEE